jgi:Winged helix DNA-binding domain
MLDVDRELGEPADILQLRLANQHLAHQRTTDPRAIVAHLGAVQSQDYAAAQWALGLRLANVTRAALECAFNCGAIVRTHVLRPTWHFVTPEDIRWMLALTAPRIKRAMASRDRELGLNDELVARTNTIIARALEGGKQLTRPEIGAALRVAGIAVADGSVLSHLVSRAELDGVICSGALRDKQHTHVLLEERVPPVPSLSRDEAVAELVGRYFASHGPATLNDFAWWSGLTVADGRRGLEAHGSRFVSERVAGVTYWFASSGVPTGTLGPAALLLPNFDEFTVAYRSRQLFYPRELISRPGPRDDAPFGNVIVIGGQVVGMWKRSVVKERLRVEPRWFNPPARREETAFVEAAERYAVFAALPL